MKAGVSPRLGAWLIRTDLNTFPPPTRSYKLVLIKHTFTVKAFSMKYFIKCLRGSIRQHSGELTLLKCRTSGSKSEKAVMKTNVLKQPEVEI